MGKVVILDENTSNKIAAGEVVERPASVIKELIENSIDAGADAISVEIKNGGISFMKITDNGGGIEEDDVEIAFERHATSKIRKADDLESISTMGFRGEALASIAAVATVELTTKVQKNAYGMFVKIQGGVTKEVRQTGCPVGTTFVIRDLFYNTPARFKFLKKDSTEAGYISDAVSRIALGNPAVSFRLISNHATLLHTPGNSDLLSTIFSIYGKETAKEVYEINYADERVKITGYAGKPEIARANRNYQSVYINKRYIKSKIVSSAIDEAYKTFLLKNKFAFIVINMEINPMLVDVNVHPAKMEVRFSEEQEIFRSVYHAVNSSLLNRPLIRSSQLTGLGNDTFKFKNSTLEKPDYVQKELGVENRFVKEVLSEEKNAEKIYEVRNISQKEENNKRGTQEVHRSGMVEVREGTNEKDLDKIKTAVYEPEKANRTLQTQEEQIDKPEDRPKLSGFKMDGPDIKEGVPDIIDTEKKNASDVYVNISEKETDDISFKAGEKDARKEPEVYTPEPEVLTKDTRGAVAGDEVLEKEADRILNHSKIIGQAFSTYILLQYENELILIDQHAAHERIMYERMKEKYRNSETFSQNLIAPVVIELTLQEIKFLEDKKGFFSKIGFVYENFGNNSVILRAVPVAGEGVAVKQLFLEVVDFIISANKPDYSAIADDTLYTIACKAAVKANKKLDDMEIKNLLKELAEIENPYTCPHGRPTIVKITQYELEKKFKRIV